MNIIIQEFKMSYKSLISYTIGMLATFYVFVLLFDSFVGNAALLDQVLSNFPKEFKAALGFTDVTMSEINGYLSFLFTYLVLIGAVYGMKMGVSVLSEEIRVKAADFLLVKPVKRLKLFGCKLVTVLVCLLLQNLAVYIFGLIAISMVKNSSGFSISIFTWMNLSTLMVQLFFVGIGFIVSVLIKKIKAVMPITLGIVFIFFIIELINQSLMDAKLTYLTPFSYFRGSDILANRGFELKYVILDLGVFVVFTFLSYIIYQRKDMPSV